MIRVLIQDCHLRLRKYKATIEAEQTKCSTILGEALYKLIGVVDSNHLPPGRMTPEQHADVIFSKLDINKDGQLSRAEFIRGASGDGDIMGMLQFTQAS
ncbi:unnamed protein product [Schistocephalus solidus]|uniref:EF-hand domain-containing protein n=1 Tax=Schistocephalus solidus TaxID=70667 RepID=A0A183SV65_SCHSO|nr:unnamed protein product [Schistocephalus solidus]